MSWTLEETKYINAIREEIEVLEKRLILTDKKINIIESFVNDLSSMFIEFTQKISEIWGS